MGIFGILVIIVVILVFYRISRYYIRGSGRRHSAHIRKAKNSSSRSIRLNYKETMIEKTSCEGKASELLKTATQKHKEKDFYGAISFLQEAYELMAKSSTSYPIETFLRLPMYLQQAGKYAESVVEFQKLLNNVPTKISKEFSQAPKRIQDSLAAMDRSIIFDKMRLTAQREKQFVYAAYYQMLSDANRCVGLKLQERTEEVDVYKDGEYWSSSDNSLLVNAKKESLIKALNECYMIFAQKCNLNSLDKLETDSATLLGIENTPSVPCNIDVPKTLIQ